MYIICMVLKRNGIHFKMIINAVGCPHSGMSVLYDIIKSTGVRVRGAGPDIVFDRRLIDRRIPYDLTAKIPDWVLKWIDEFDINGYNDYIKLGGNFFHDSWGRFCAMVALEERYPNIRFLIMLRDPRKIIGKWFAVNGSTGPEITIDTYKRTVERIYSFILDQVRYLKNKPIIMEYELFIGGKYTKQIFDMFDIEHSLENYHSVQGYLKSAGFTAKDYTGNVSDIINCQNELKKLGE